MTGYVKLVISGSEDSSLEIHTAYKPISLALYGAPRRSLRNHGEAC